MTDIEKMKTLLTLAGLVVAIEAELQYVREEVNFDVIEARTEALTEEIREITSSAEETGKLLAAVILDMFPEARRSSEALQ